MLKKSSINLSDTQRSLTMPFRSFSISSGVLDEIGLPVRLSYKGCFYRTATAGSDVVQSGRPIFDEFSNICGRISATTWRMLSSKWSSVCGLSA
ncbi:hypothetical protein TNCV_3432901 [Trichonephila clavipes]|nr:hypothetical protein TNCV_3432901 [Trichonephila clavipes]